MGGREYWHFHRSSDGKLTFLLPVLPVCLLLTYWVAAFTSDMKLLQLQLCNYSKSLYQFNCLTSLNNAAQTYLYKRSGFIDTKRDNYRSSKRSLLLLALLVQGCDPLN